MKKSRVLFISVKDGEGIKQIDTKLKILLDKTHLLGKIKKDAYVAIKMHFGEEGNTGYVNPVYVATIVKELREKEAHIFLTDTNTLYKGSRTNAIEHLNLAYRHGFSSDKVQVPIIIADGLKGDDYDKVKIKGFFIKTAYIASAIRKAEILVVISHFKGHMMTGFGGAIKNLGMGCAARRGKLIQHGGISPFVRKEKCIACERCIKICPVSAIKLIKDKAKIDSRICIGCASCIAACPVAAIDIEWEKGADTIQERMAEYAKAVISDKKDKCIYINFAIKITKECDCLAKDDPKICSDIGIFASFDPVSIDQSCVDKVNKISGKDLFREQHPDCDWQKQLKHAQDIGLGSRDYELMEIR